MINLTVSEDFIIYAFRYVLGRATHAPSVFINEMREPLHNLSKRTIRIMVEEIEYADEKCGLGSCGINDVLWLDFLEDLKAKLAIIPEED